MVPVVESDISGTTYKGGMSFGLNSIHMVEERISLDYGLTVNQRFASGSFASESDELTDLLNLGAIPGIGAIDLTIYENTRVLTTFWTIDVPLTISYRTKSGVFFSGGGYVNYLLSAKHKSEHTTHIPVFEVIPAEELITDPFLLSLIPGNSTEVITDESKDDMNDLGFGILAGVGYQANSWIVRLSYQHGLNDIRDDDMIMKVKSQAAINLSLGILMQDLFMKSGDKAIYDLDKTE